MRAASARVFAWAAKIADSFYNPRGKPDIEARVKKIIAEQLGVEESQVTNEKSLRGRPGRRLAGHVELVMALEDEFGIEIPDEDAEKITTVQNAIDYANTHQRPEPLRPRCSAGAQHSINKGLTHEPSSRCRDRPGPASVPWATRFRTLGQPPRRKVRHRPHHQVRRHELCLQDCRRGQGF